LMRVYIYGKMNQLTSKYKVPLDTLYRSGSELWHLGGLQR
jgi:hypothetical protein